METYGHDFGKLKRAFVDFVQRLPFYGVAVVCVDDANVRAILPDVTKPLVTYGLADDADLRATDVVNVGGRMRFVARAKGAPDLAVELDAGRRPQRAQRARRDRGRTRDRRPRRGDREGARGVPRRRPPLPAPRRRRARRRRHVHADRRLRPPSGRDGGDARRGARELPGPPAGARVPAAPLHAHARPVRGLRPRAVDRRRAGAGRRLPGRRGADRRRRRPRARARGARRRQGRAGVRRETSPTCRRRSARSRATATSW